MRADQADIYVHVLPTETKREDIFIYFEKGRNMNPNWTRDELIITLDFYLKNRTSIPDTASDEIRNLSELLNQLGRSIFNSIDTDEKFRNTNGVYMKLMNFRAIDPTYSGQGLTSGSKTDKEVWNEFSSDPQRCAHVRDAIVHSIKTSVRSDATRLDEQTDDLFEIEAVEGKILTRQHKTRERSSKLVKQKISSVIRQQGCLSCEACGFEFEKVYGEIGKNFAECHHRLPLSELASEEKTHIDDLEVLCANCHRMIHRQRPWLSLESLKERISAARKTSK